MARLEQLWGAMFRGQPTYPTSAKGSPGPWAGIATINSNAASVTITSALVTSDSLIFAFPRNCPAVASGSGLDLVCTTIAPGSAFIIGTADGQPIIASSVVDVAWVMYRNNAK